MSPTELKSADSLADLVRLAADVSARLHRKTPKVATTPSYWPRGKVISVERRGSKILVSNRAIECLSREELAFALALELAPSDRRTNRKVAMLVGVAFALEVAVWALASPTPLGPVSPWLRHLFPLSQPIIYGGALFAATRIGKQSRAATLLSALSACPNIEAARAFIRKRATDRLPVEDARPAQRRPLKEQIESELRDFDKTVGELGLIAEYRSEP